MKRVVKIGFPIVCVVIIGGTFFLLNGAKKRVNNMKSQKETNSTVVENIVDNTSKTNNIDEDNTNKKVYSVPVEKDYEENEV